MKKITLTKGQESIVDDSDFEKFGDRKWYAQSDAGSGRFYAARREKCADWSKSRLLYLHRAIAGEPLGMEVDHINRDTLDNRRSNLRAVTTSQNQMNRSGATRDSRTGIRGVSMSGKRYRVQLRFSGEVIYVGTFRNIEDAKKAYADANAKYYGEFGGVV